MASTITCSLREPGNLGDNDYRILATFLSSYICMYMIHIRLYAHFSLMSHDYMHHVSIT